MDIALVGPHGSGKTTFGLRLAQVLGVPFHEEVGRLLSEDRIWRAHGVDASCAQTSFDREVMRRELERDIACSKTSDRVVETWHPGNLAYILARSPGLAPLVWQQAVAACRTRPAVVVVLDCADATLRRRKNEAGDFDFFARVGRSGEQCARALGLSILARVDSEFGLEEQVAVVAARWRAHATSGLERSHISLAA